ncbi:MAG: thermonuclease family protein [Candidatus Pacebacteria bacterium]|jgi:micrococcal nuclease|nr:thermonuclease family protein [Candidatus Paceibacterota bacterium]
MKLTVKKISALVAGLIVLVLAGFGLSKNILPAPLTQTAPLQTSEAVVTKIIDGDTLIVSGGDHVRLLGVDSDEKGYPCFDAARLRLEELVLSKTVRLEPDAQDKDQYGRLLRYVFYNGENINEKIVAEGLAVARFYPENQKHKNEIVSAEAEAIKNKTGCKWGGPPEAGNAAAVPDSKKLNWVRMPGAAIEACDAGQSIGKEAVVQGYVAQATKSKTDTVFLNFDKPYPNNCFAAVIFKSSLAKFGSPETLFDKKAVRIKGKIQDYQGKPEIILSDPEQIEIGN